MKNIFQFLGRQKKKIFLGLLGVFVILQVFRPEANDGSAYSANDITNAVGVPPAVKTILETSCNDCHSNHTNNPGYWHIQPIGWWLSDHITEAKKELNLTEFNTYTVRRKMKKFREIAEQIEEGEMPLDSYLWIHSDAKLTGEQKKTMIDWAKMNEQILEKKYPDSVPPRKH